MKLPRSRSPWADSLHAGPASPEARTAVADRHPPAPSASERRSVGASERRSVGASISCGSGAGKSEAKFAVGGRLGLIESRAKNQANGLKQASPGQASRKALSLSKGHERRPGWNGQEDEKPQRGTTTFHLCSAPLGLGSFLPSRAQTPFGHALVPATPLSGVRVHPRAASHHRNGVSPAMAFPNGVWERGEKPEPVSRH
jgi:hypothetical protein